MTFDALEIDVELHQRSRIIGSKSKLIFIHAEDAGGAWVLERGLVLGADRHGSHRRGRREDGGGQLGSTSWRRRPRGEQPAPELTGGGK